MENACVVMWDVPVGQHVLGIQVSEGGSNKPKKGQKAYNAHNPFYLSHMVVVK